MSTATPSNEEKDRLWRDYHAGGARRVPVRLNTNPRIILLDPALNSGGYTFEDAARDPQIHVRVSLQWQHYLRTVLNRYADAPIGLPEVWDVHLWVYNVHEAAAFGAPVQFTPGQVPCTEPILTDANKHDIFKCDIERPLEHGFLADCLRFWEEMRRVCEGMKYEGRPVRLLPFAPTTSDGPFTVACNLRGIEFVMDLTDDPDFADRVMDLVTRAAIIRRHDLWRYWGDRIERRNVLADDSCAMLSPAMYRERVLPHHRRIFEDAGPTLTRCIHMCGDATHLFPLLHEQLNVTSFDTGFPVDHGRMRRVLGPDVEMFGGVEVATLLGGTPEQVHGRACAILNSGVTEGGRFIMQEANNLPPCCPLANLAAMYRAGLEHGAHAPAPLKARP